MEDRERVYTAKKIRDEQSAARKTLVRRFVIWTAVVLVVLIVFATIGPLNRAVMLSTANPVPTESFAVINGGEVEVFSGDSKTASLSLPGGTSAKDVLAAQSEGQIAFAVKGSMTLTVHSAKERTSIAVPTQFGDQDQIVRLSPGPRGFYVVVQDMSDTASVRATNRPTRTLLVSGEASPVTAFEDGMLASSLDGTKTVTRAKDGQFSVEGGGSTQALAKLEGSVIWDYDFQNDVLAAGEEATLHIVRGGSKKSVVPAFFHKIIEVKAVPSLQQVWVSVVKPGGSSAVMAFDYSGKFAGTKLVRKGEIRVPYLDADEIVLALVQGPPSS